MKFTTVSLNDFLWPQQSGQEGRISSRKIAEYFSKRHDNILRDIQQLDIVDDFNALNFEESEYTTSRGKKYPEYLLTRQGCFYLIMGYTGTEAAQVKVELLLKFDQMERKVLAQEKRQLALEATRSRKLDHAQHLSGVEPAHYDEDLELLDALMSGEDYGYLDPLVRN